jgi:5-methylcytosine-specific restriction endonuclease McrA
MGKHYDEAYHWYGLMRWKKRRRAQLRKHPLCKFCLEHSGLVTPATVVDHVVPHGGDRYKFEFGELQSLCTPCHDSVKRTIENRGYSTEIGVDGWPVDKDHPCYAKR